MSSTQHSLALPLSADYTNASRNGFSFFTTTTTPAPTASHCNGSINGDSCGAAARNSTALLERYLDDLCSFLRAARLVQSHPDNYFQFMRGETWAASAVHFDGSPVEGAELAETQLLLRGFGPLLHGEQAMAKLRMLVRDGPPPLSSAKNPASSSGDEEKGEDAPLRALNEFYSSTRRLMLGRVRRPESDAAACTLLSVEESARLDSGSAEARAARAREEQILDLVLSHGMNPKKQHEVRIMRATIRDLVSCCNSAARGNTNTTTTTDAAVSTQEEHHRDASTPADAAVPPVETVINLGEGKGYVSRAVALCDNLQVIGLDCNPAHKERAVERVETLLETSVSSRSGRSRVNLLYEPRGHVASIACRVEESVDWAALLQGHVRTCPDRRRGNANSSACDASRVYPCDGSGAVPEAATGTQQTAEVTTAFSPLRGEETVRLVCRVCGKVVRLENTTVIMRHVYTHLQKDSGDNGGSGDRAKAQSSLIPSAETLREWNLALSQHAYVARLTETLFTVAEAAVGHSEHPREAALLKRPRDGRAFGREEQEEEEEERLLLDAPATEKEKRMDKEARYLTLARHPSAGVVALDSEGGAQPQTLTLQRAHTARGYRVVLLMPRSLPAAVSAGDVDAVSHATGKADEQGGGEEEEFVNASRTPQSPVSPSSPSSSAAPVRWVYTRTLATVAGYDCGAGCHQLVLDGEVKKRVFRLYRLPVTESSATDCERGATTVPSKLPHHLSDGTHEARSVDDVETRIDEAPTHVGRWTLPDADVWGVERVALVLSVLPPALPSTPSVLVPSVRNTVLIGLHPCGDLGSNVCRIFRNSAARGLLLVSCCWHALTPHGFPLSQALRRRGMTTNSVSLLLATQPLDAWSTASPEGHRSSAKVLFYRSLFKLLWERLAREWAGQRSGHTVDCCVRRRSEAGTAQEANTTDGVHEHGEGEGDSASAGRTSCAFPAAPPHLEPAFLRRISRVKETLTFPEFIAAIAQTYVYEETAKDSPYTPWRVGEEAKDGCCAACRAAQQAFVRAALQERRLPEDMAREFEGEHFAQFLGLTVLRMWMCHLVESLLLLDRALYLHEELSAAGAGEDSAVSLVPLFDGALSPRMYGILARRGGSASA